MRSQKTKASADEKNYLLQKWVCLWVCRDVLLQ